MVNDLNQKQCRNFLLQMANQWEYVEVNQVASGEYVASDVNLTAAPDMNTDANGSLLPGLPEQGICRTMSANGNNTITPDSVITTCADSSTNGIILDSR